MEYKDWLDEELIWTKKRRENLTPAGNVMSLEVKVK
jgi:hypothetical protein